MVRSHALLIDALGGPTLVGRFVGASLKSVSMWKVRGIPWRFRARVAEMAILKRKDLPAGFLDPAAAGPNALMRRHAQHNGEEPSPCP